MQDKRYVHVLKCLLSLAIPRKLEMVEQTRRNSKSVLLETAVRACLYYDRAT